MTERAYAFDAYGTLFDVHAAMERYRPALGDCADAFSAHWRAKQLEYAFVRTLMGRYIDFWTLTQEALDHTLASFPAVDRELRAGLLDVYWRLPAFPDVLPALTKLRRMGATLVIFTNGTQAMAEAAASAASVLPLIDMVVSVDETRHFKTSPETYRHLAERLGLPATDITLVSSNRWDVAGAQSYGLETIWLNRQNRPDEYHDALPRRVIASLAGLELTLATE